MTRASRATATSRPSSGTPRASAKPMAFRPRRSLEAPAATLPVNRWIIGEVAATVAAMDRAFAAYRFDDAANAIYSFAWDRFCDWYLELIKGAIDDETKAVAGWVLDQILVMLHPFMPFITEELWTGARRPRGLSVDHGEMAGARRDARRRRQRRHRLADQARQRTAHRQGRTRLAAGRAPDRAFPGVAERPHRETCGAARPPRAARGDRASIPPPPAPSAQLVIEGETITVPLEGVIDIARRTRPPDQGARRRGEGTRRPCRPPEQPVVRRTRETRSGRKGARRPRRQGGRGRSPDRRTGAAGVMRGARTLVLATALLCRAAGRQGRDPVHAAVGSAERTAIIADAAAPTRIRASPSAICASGTMATAPSPTPKATTALSGVSRSS